MRIVYSSKFGREYKKLPDKIKKLAEEREKIFCRDPFGPRLKTRKLSGKFKGKLRNYWSFSISYKYRIIFRFVDKNTVRFYLIGTHRIYR